jgi:hypothetical protein
MHVPSSIRFLTILLVLHGPAASADPDAAKKAHAAGDFATAMQEWRRDAARGDAAALMNLGRMMERGEGVAADPYTAFVLYRVALGRGNRQAEQAANRVANLLPGMDLARGVEEAKRLVGAGTFVPPSPVLAVAPKPAAAPAVSSAAAPSTAAAGLEYRYACTMLLRWQDRGSGGARDIALFQPEAAPGFHIVGGHAQSNYDRADDCALTLRSDAAHLLAPPAGWERVWRDKGTGAQMDGSVWRARSPDADHVCLGDVGQTGKDQPALPQYRCVHRFLVTSLAPAAPLWTTENTGAETPLAIYRLPHAKSFVAAPGGQAPAQIMDLDPNAQCR